MIAKHLLYRSKLISYYIVGQGTPIFLLHGYQADSRIWQEIILLLQDKYMLIVPDLPGHGKTEKIRSVNSMEFLAEVVYRLFLSLGLKGAIFAGHSMGGYVALAFAEKYPELVDSLFLFNSHPFEDSMSRVLARNREAGLIEIGKKHFLLLSFAKKNFYQGNHNNLQNKIKLATEIALEQSDKGMIADIAGMSARIDRRNVIINKRFPVCIVCGKDDPRMPKELVEKMRILGIDVTLIEECGHMSILEKPDELAQLIIHKHK